MVGGSYPEIERFQGQLNFLDRRVALATIVLSLFQPQARVALPPSGSLSVEVSDVIGGEIVQHAASKRRSRRRGVRAELLTECQDVQIW